MAKILKLGVLAIKFWTLFSATESAIESSTSSEWYSSSSSNELIPLPSFFKEINRSYEEGNPLSQLNNTNSASYSTEENLQDLTSNETHGHRDLLEHNMKLRSSSEESKPNKTYVLVDKKTRRKRKNWPTTKLPFRPSPRDDMDFAKPPEDAFTSSSELWNRRWGENRNEMNGDHGHGRQKNYERHESPFQNPNNGPPSHARNNNYNNPPSRHQDRNVPTKHRVLNYQPPPPRNKNHAPNGNSNGPQPRPQHLNVKPRNNNFSYNYSIKPNHEKANGPPFQKEFENKNNNNLRSWHRGRKPEKIIQEQLIYGRPFNQRNTERDKHSQNPSTSFKNQSPFNTRNMPSPSSINSEADSPQNENRPQFHHNSNSNPNPIFYNSNSENHNPPSIFPNTHEADNESEAKNRNSRNLEFFEPPTSPEYGINSHGLPPKLNEPITNVETWRDRTFDPSKNSIDRIYITTETPIIETESMMSYSPTHPTPYHSDPFFYSQEDTGNYHHHPPLLGGFKPSYGPPTKPPGPPPHLPPFPSQHLPHFPPPHLPPSPPIFDNNFESESKVYKHVTVHIPPEPEPRPPKIIQLTRKPEKHYSIVFIKAPEVNQLPEKVLLPPVPEQKTLIYVLTKHRKNPVKVVTPKPTSPSPPEVYFVQYKDKKKDTPYGSNNDHYKTTNPPPKHYEDINPITKSKETFNSLQTYQSPATSYQSIDSGGGNYPTQANFPILTTPKNFPSVGVGHTYNYNIPLPRTQHNSGIVDSWSQSSDQQIIGKPMSAQNSNIATPVQSTDSHFIKAHSIWSNLTSSGQNFIVSKNQNTGRPTISSFTVHDQIQPLEQSIYQQSNTKNSPRTKKYNRDEAFQQLLKNQVANYGANWSSLIKSQIPSNNQIVKGSKFNYSVVTTPTSIASHLPTISSEQKANGSKSHYYVTLALPIDDKDKFSVGKPVDTQKGDTQIPLYFESKRVVDLSIPANLLAKEKSKYGQTEIHKRRVRVVKRIKSHRNNNNSATV